MHMEMMEETDERRKMITMRERERERERETILY
jgi:hypothetical protein